MRFIESKMSAPKPPAEPKILATYKGEWTHVEQIMRASTEDGDYEWIVAREVPAMTFYVDGIDMGKEVSALPAPATWLPLVAEIQLPKVVSKTTKSSPVRAPAVGSDSWPAEDKTETVILGPMALAALNAVPGVSVATKNPVAVAAAWGPALVVGISAASGVGGALIGGSTAHRVVTGTLRRMVARRREGIRRIKGDIQQVGSDIAGAVAGAHVPGWPASNFRRGKGAKRSKKAASSLTSMRIDGAPGYKASFDMEDGSIQDLESIAMSVVVLDSDGTIAWETADIHVPADDSSTLVPKAVQLVNAVMVLLAEAQSYVEFVSSEPDLTVEVG